MCYTGLYSYKFQNVHKCYSGNSSGHWRRYTVWDWTDWIEQGLTSESTHFGLLRRRWAAASARIVAAVRAVCAVLSSVCATTVDNSGVYVYYLKGTVSVCFRCPAKIVGFSGTRLYLCIYNQPS